MTPKSQRLVAASSVEGSKSAEGEAHAEPVKPEPAAAAAGSIRRSVRGGLLGLIAIAIFRAFRFCFCGR